MSKRKLINCVGITSAVSMAIIPAIFAVAPVFQVSDTNAATASSYIYATAGVDQAIAFSTTPKVTMSGTQTIGETIFTTGYGNVSLDTNAVGYAIQLSTTDSNLVNQDTLTTSTRNKSIPSIETSQTGTQMLADTTLGSSWGFTKESVSGTQGNSTDLTRTYSPVSGTTTISDMDFYDEDYTGTENFNIGYGVKVSPDLRTGRYTSTVKFTVVGYVPVTDLTTIFDINTMQEISPKICKNTTTPLVSATEITYVKTQDNTKIPRTTLTDERDGKTYLVSKFADGHCWMSQNLELELDTETALTSELTDLTTKSSWMPNVNTSAIDEYPSIDGVDYSARPNFGYEYVTGSGTLSHTPSTNDGKSEWERSGYFYDFDAAHAGSFGSGGDTDSCGNGGYLWWSATADSTDCVVEDSICPKGWTLPDIGDHKIAMYNSYNNYGDYGAFGNNEFVETYRISIEDEDYSTISSAFSERLALNPAWVAFHFSQQDNSAACASYPDSYNCGHFGDYASASLNLWTNLDGFTGAYYGYHGFFLQFAYVSDGYSYVNYTGSLSGSWYSEAGAAGIGSIRCVAR